VRGKGSRRERLPLPVDVGSALADHLRRGRPSSAEGKHQRDRRFDWWIVARQSPDRLELIDLNGIVVPPRAYRPRHRGR